MSEEQNRQIYSYHTFLFPFIWKTDNSTKPEQFLSVLSISGADSNDTNRRWVLDDWSERKKNSWPLSQKDWKLDYAAFQYFTDSANDLIFNSKGSNAVHCYKYNKNDGKYKIRKGDKTYELDINNIRLNIYDAGIAILIFEMENTLYKTLDDVNSINEYGRRINFPYLTVPEIPHSLCADSISISFGENENPALCEKFLDTTLRIAGKSDYCDIISLTYIMKPIQTLLDGEGKDNGGQSITTNISHKSKEKFYIKPCVDDRMFVCCLVADYDLSNELKGVGSSGLSFVQETDTRLKRCKCSFTQNGDTYRVSVENGRVYLFDEKEFNDRVIKGSVENESRYIVTDQAGHPHYSYMEGWLDETTLSSRVYKFLYIENELSCQSPEMKKRLLSESVYDRWVYTGTLFGITHHSICCITNPAVINQVINPFLTLYVQMAILTLAQRSVILMLSDEAATVSNGFQFRDGKDISEEDIKKIELLQAKYVKVQNQLLLSEVTIQEQGVEIYQILRKSLYIGKNLNDLDMSMNNLRDVANITNERLERSRDEKENRTFNCLGFIVSIMFIIEPLSYYISDKILFNEPQLPYILWFFSSLVMLIITLLVLFFHPICDFISGKIDKKKNRRTK